MGFVRRFEGATERPWAGDGGTMLNSMQGRHLQFWKCHPSIYFICQCGIDAHPRLFEGCRDVQPPYSMTVEMYMFSRMLDIARSSVIGCFLGC